MSELKELLWTPATVVGLALGIIGGVATNYFQRSLDKVFGRWSRARKARYEALNSEYKRRLKSLAANPALVPLYAAEENRLRWKALGRFFSGIMFGGLTVLFVVERLDNPPSVYFYTQATLFAGMSVLALVAGVKHLQDAHYHGSVLESLYRVEASFSDKGADLQVKS